jgi:hypothetical protein
VVDAQLVLARAEATKLRADAGLVADQQHLEAALAMRTQGALDRRGRSKIAPHGVKSDHDEWAASGQHPAASPFRSGWRLAAGS